MSRHRQTLAERQAAMKARHAAPAAVPPCLDLLGQHYSVQELSEAWHAGVDHIQRLFANEPGVVDFGQGRRRMLRIPKAVAERVYRERIISPSPSRARRSEAC